MPSNDYISIVIIGINTETTIQQCIQSVKKANYPQEKLEIIYVDGGSKDRSVEIAQKEKIKVIELQQKRPTPGRGRNAGWKEAKYKKILFLDGDTTLDLYWLQASQSLVAGNIVAVCGKRVEREKEKNFYHLINNIEWDAKEGEIAAFGGDVLIDRAALNDVGGYDEELICGEDPDLSYRLRKAGGKILRCNGIMTVHDIAMNTFYQYWKRSIRTGYGYAEIAARYIGEQEKFWLKDCLRIVFSTVLPILFLIYGFIMKIPILGSILALALIFKNLIYVPKFKKKYHLTTKQSIVYALHLCFVVYPQMVGILNYLVHLRPR